MRRWKLRIAGIDDALRGGWNVHVPRNDGCAIASIAAHYKMDETTVVMRKIAKVPFQRF